MEVSDLVGYVLGIYIIYRIIDYFYRKPFLRNLQSRYILITGCDTGFGHELAKRLDRKGCNVFAGCITEKGETELQKSCSSRLKTVNMDVSKQESVRKAFEFVKRSLPEGRGLHGLMNNAGISGKIGPFEWLTMADYNQVFGVNLLGLVDTTQVFLPLLKKEKGRIVCTASIFGRHSLNGSAPYCISKYGVEAFCDSIRRQLGGFKVGVHLIEPGFHKTNITSTDMLTKNLRAAFQQAPAEVQQEYGEEFVEASVQSMLEKFVSGFISENIHDVVDAYEHALLALFPRARYMVGKDAKFFWWPVQMMPEWLGDRLLMLAAGKNKPVPACLKK